MSAVLTSSTVPAASRLVRFGAFFLDFMILVFAQRLGSYMGGIIAAVIMTARDAPQAVLEAEISRGIGFGALFWSLVFLAVNYGVLQGMWGGTAGKLLCGIRVVNRDGAPIGVTKSLFRTGLYFVSAMPFYAGFFMALWDRKTRTLHDWFCGTLVEVARPAMAADARSLRAPRAIPVQPLLRPAFPNEAATEETEEDYSPRAA